MCPISSLLQSRGESLAASLDAYRAPLCDTVAGALALEFPELRCDLVQANPPGYTRSVFLSSPLHLHTLMLITLRFHTLSVIAGEYRWAWPLLLRYDITERQLLTFIQSYFDAARELIALGCEERLLLRAVERAIVAELKEVMAAPLGEPAAVG